jgi:hypothetical protein
VSAIGIAHALLITASCEKFRRAIGQGNFLEAREETQVLRISVEQHASSLSLVIEGRLVGPWVEELRRVSQERPAGVTLLSIDLCGLTAMDAAGHALLEELHQSGATLSCSDVLNRYLVEQMARPAGDVQAACRPCRRFPSHDDLPATAEDFLESFKAS